MADDDQHGDEAVKESVNRFDHEKGEDRNRNRRGKGRQRRIAEQKGHYQPDTQCKQADVPVGNDDETECRGNAFAAFETEPDRKIVAENADSAGKQRRDDVKLGKQAEKNIIGSWYEAVCQPGGEAGFKRVENNGKQRQGFVAGAQNVGGADVAGADFADVVVAGHAGQNQAEGNGAEQIAAEGTEE